MRLCVLFQAAEESANAQEGTQLPCCWTLAMRHLSHPGQSSQLV